MTFHKMLCLMYGHEDMCTREGTRLYLTCRRCLRETAGWRDLGTVPRGAAVLTSIGLQGLRDTRERLNRDRDGAA